jgi:hypothetical protein
VMRGKVSQVAIRGLINEVNLRLKGKDEGPAGSGM